jgi:cytochrome c553
MRGGRRYGVESRMIDKPQRRIASVLAVFAFLALALAGCGGKAPESASAEATVPGEVHVCSSCHGPNGRSISPTFPRLAGQQKDYIIAQLQAFRDKTRADPHAQTYMWGMAARLSDPTIDAIATYYSSQTPAASSPSDSPQTVAGKNIFAEGIPSEGVPACMSCHGEQAEGNGPIPRLAGQHQAYLARQLEAFASMARANEIMHENSKDLTSQQISEVTAYLATL